MTTRTKITRRASSARTAVAPKRRRTAISSRKVKSSGKIFNVVVPSVFILVILFCLGFLSIMGYRTVTASSFFGVRNINIRGVSRAPRDEIERIVRLQAEKNGVWNAELEQVKADVEKLDYVKTAVVSRILPDGIQVRIEERIPLAVVRIGRGDFWFDADAVELGTVGKNESRGSFVLGGWDESGSLKAKKDNQDRIKSFLKIRDEWHNLGIESRVIALNLNDLQDAQAKVEDSGETVTISLGKEEFGKRLQRALTVIEGKGKSIELLISHGNNVVAKYRDS